jgi:hypothetical protein
VVEAATPASLCNLQLCIADGLFEKTKDLEPPATLLHAHWQNGAVVQMPFLWPRIVPLSSEELGCSQVRGKLPQRRLEAMPANTAGRSHGHNPPQRVCVHHLNKFHNARPLKGLLPWKDIALAVRGPRTLHAQGGEKPLLSDQQRRHSY